MIGNTFQFAWEISLIEWCQNNLPSFVIEIAKVATNLGDVIFCVGILGFLYLCYDKKAGKRVLFNVIVSLMINGEIKNIVKRRRPYFDNEGIKCLKIVDADYDLYDIEKQGFSFPSMHSSNITTISGSLYENYRKKALFIIAVAISSIVGVSRFVLGCHYPTDVLCGWGLGLFATIFLSKLQDKLSDKAAYLFMFVLGIIGMFYCKSTDFFSAYGIAIGFIISTYIDSKYINFKNTRNIIKMVIRLIVAFGIFIGISEGLKIPFSEEILDASTLFAYCYRIFRYALATFVGMGLTPAIYKYNILKLDDKMKDGD